ncbi:MAG TPA: hypothetical protein VNS32_02200 [Flavisolibacter sp.]|nr:hypothetical protein [Flavisolibacter sp.]
MNNQLKIKLILFCSVFFTYISGLARPIDSLKLSQQLNGLQTSVDSVSRKVSQIDTAQKSLTKSVQTLRNDDSLERSSIASSFSKSLDEAKKNPESLYDKPFKSFWVSSVAAFLFLFLFLYYSFGYFNNSALCKDESFEGDCVLKDPKSRPYSYARVQLFWWTLIILFCYAWFYGRYGVLLPLNPTVVLLLGSGLAVYIFGKAIDSSQIKEENKQMPTRHQDVYETQGFHTDILSDDNGISIHRLQAAAFNIIYGIGFLGAFFYNIGVTKYPFTDFESWQLSLLGISGAGYLGLKAMENGSNTRSDRLQKAVEDQLSGSTDTTGIIKVKQTVVTETPANKRDLQKFSS